MRQSAGWVRREGVWGFGIAAMRGKRGLSFVVKVVLKRWGMLWVDGVECRTERDHGKVAMMAKAT